MNSLLLPLLWTKPVLTIVIGLMPISVDMEEVMLAVAFTEV
jgi:hypothetical protein